MSDNPEYIDIFDQIYLYRREVHRLRREAFGSNTAASISALDELIEREADLSELESRLADLASQNAGNGLLFRRGIRPQFGTLGRETTGLEAEIHLRMEAVTISIYHLFDRIQSPLLSCRVRNYSSAIRRIQVTSFIDGYSAQAVDTIEAPPGSDWIEIKQLPTLFPSALHQVNELTRATLNVRVDELGENGVRIESHTTHPIWLLARTSAPLAVRDPASGKWVDHSRYLGAFVTPNAPELIGFLRQAVELHPQKRLAGYQGERSQVEPQVRAIFEALKRSAEIQYVNSVLAFSPDTGASNQRVRLPRESLAQRQANCIDGTILFASLLEAVSLNPGLVIVPGHAFLAWQSWSDESSDWRYLETTMIGSGTYEEAAAAGAALATRYRMLSEKKEDPNLFRLWPLRKLRTEHRITPLE